MEVSDFDANRQIHRPQVEVQPVPEDHQKTKKNLLQKVAVTQPYWLEMA